MWKAKHEKEKRKKVMAYTDDDKAPSERLYTNIHQSFNYSYENLLLNSSNDTSPYPCFIKTTDGCKSPAPSFELPFTKMVPPDEFGFGFRPKSRTENMLPYPSLLKTLDGRYSPNLSSDERHFKMIPPNEIGFGFRPKSRTDSRKNEEFLDKHRSMEPLDHLKNLGVYLSPESSDNRREREFCEEDKYELCKSQSSINSKRSSRSVDEERMGWRLLNQDLFNRRSTKDSRIGDKSDLRKSQGSIDSRRSSSSVENDETALCTNQEFDRKPSTTSFERRSVGSRSSHGSSSKKPISLLLDKDISGSRESQGSVNGDGIPTRFVFLGDLHLDSSFNSTKTIPDDPAELVLPPSPEDASPEGSIKSNSSEDSFEFSVIQRYDTTETGRPSGELLRSISRESNRSMMSASAGAMVLYKKPRKQKKPKRPSAMPPVIRRSEDELLESANEGLALSRVSSISPPLSTASSASPPISRAMSVELPMIKIPSLEFPSIESLTFEAPDINPLNEDSNITTLPTTTLENRSDLNHGSTSSELLEGKDITSASPPLVPASPQASLFGDGTKSSASSLFGGRSARSAGSYVSSLYASSIRKGRASKSPRQGSRPTSPTSPTGSLTNFLIKRVLSNGNPAKSPTNLSFVSTTTFPDYVEGEGEKGEEEEEEDEDDEDGDDESDADSELSWGCVGLTQQEFDEMVADTDRQREPWDKQKYEVRNYTNGEYDPFGVL